MADKYPHRQVYEVLYAKYLQTPVDTLLNIGELKNGESVLDLCAGNLAQCYAALSLGANCAYAVEEEPAMLAGNHLADDRIKVYITTVEDYLANGGKTPRGLEVFHLVVCRQAVNNWLTPETAALLPQHIYGKGRFVFNTFNTSPGDKPLAKEYWLPTTSPRDGVTSRKYMEVSYRVGDMIHHVQMAEGYEPHCTSFRWISEDEYRAMLSPHFDVKAITKERTVYYVCTKR